MSEKQKYFWKCAGVRAVKTVCQTAIATIGTASVLGAVDWRMVFSASILAGILSLLTSVAGIPEVDQKEYLDESKEAVYYEDDDEPEDDEDEDITEGN